MDRPRDPLVQRRRLCNELRRYRVDSGLTQGDAAKALDWSFSKLIRMETGVVGVALTDLRALLALYGVSDIGRIEDLMTAARDSRKQPWWHQYREILSPQFQTLIAYESEASKLQEFHPLLIPSLLQTEGYATALADSIGLEADARLVHVTLERQKILYREDGAVMTFVIDEAAVRRRVGGSEVMAEQLRHLVQLSSVRGITIRLIDFDAGAHGGLAGAFRIFELPEVLADEDSTGEHVCFLETAGPGYRVVDSPERASLYLDTFRNLEQVALSVDRTRNIIEDALLE